MLTVPQAGILELLGELGCLRKRHIGQFAAAKYGSRPEHVARMLAQLATMGKVQADDDFVMLPGRKPDFDVIRAVDVAMALTGGKMDFAAKGGKSWCFRHRGGRLAWRWSVRAWSTSHRCACGQTRSY